MIKIRLSKQGAKGNVFYRIVAIDEKRKTSGKALDILGYWHPSNKQKKVDAEKLKQWVLRGAQVTTAVEKLLDKSSKTEK